MASAAPSLSRASRAWHARVSPDVVGNPYRTAPVAQARPAPSKDADGQERVELVDPDCASETLAIRFRCEVEPRPPGTKIVAHLTLGNTTVDGDTLTTAGGVQLVLLTTVPGDRDVQSLDQIRVRQSRAA
jgi:hypothetical protein